MKLTAQIKKNLISRIKNSKNLNFLSALQIIFDSSEKELYQLSPELQTSIDASGKEIREGKFRKNDEVISEIKAWTKRNSMV